MRTCHFNKEKNYNAPLLFCFGAAILNKLHFTQIRLREIIQRKFANSFMKPI